MKNTTTEPGSLNAWLERDEPTSDAFRLTRVRRNKRLRNREEYSGSSDLHFRGPAPQNYEAERRRRQQLKNEFAIWLDGFSWAWFASYTFNMQAKPETAHAMFRNHLIFIGQRAALPVYAFRADEYGVLNGRYHIHALIGNVDGFPAYCGRCLPPRNAGDKPRPCCGVHSWPGGHARVFPYDPVISATGYVSKYVTKDLGDWDLIGNFVPITESQLTFIR